MSDLGGAFATELDKASPPEPYMTAVVTSAAPFRIRISGSTIEVPVPTGVTLAWYTPVVDDHLVLARNGSAFIILGKAE